MKKLILALCSLSLLSGCYETATGEKNGTITKLAESGVICKSWEMEIVRGGLNAGTGVNGAAFDVTIEDPALVKIAQEAIDSGAEIRIKYRKEMLSFCRSDSGSYFLTSIEILRPGIAVRGGAAAAAPTTGATVPSAGGATLSAAQLQQMLDNQSKSIDQNERLVKAVETLATAK